MRYIAKIQDADYRDLCLGMPDQYGEAYFTAPGGFSEHHNLPGGLAAHSCHMAAVIFPEHNTRPRIIKYPFWQMMAGNLRAAYACVNRGQAVCPGKIERQSICINADIGNTQRIIGGANEP